ncbi:MAG TPA: alpha-galactosidase [Vicinamibacteria bacterium]|jgi:alpha-galactosidase|nr:alpha-galactosidase [Vicinamibacteria bacterium]
MKPPVPIATVLVLTALASTAEAAVDVRRSPGGPLVIASSAAEFTLLPSGDVQAALLRVGERRTLDVPMTPSSELRVDGKAITFVLDLDQPKVSDSRGKLGAGRRVEISSAGLPIEKTLAFEVDEDFPNVGLASVTYRNTSTRTLVLDRIEVQRHAFAAPTPAGELWSFAGASFKWGVDDVARLLPGFSRQNLLGGLLRGGYGGGIPVVAVWSATVGEAIGHIENLPLVLSLPVTVDSRQTAHAAVVIEPKIALKPGETYSTPRTFVSVYSGDFYEPLRLYSQALRREGLAFHEASPEAYSAAWCGWGYEFDVTPAQMVGTIPKLKELGIRWATLDDRWFETYGDWNPRPDTFPGDAIQRMVAEFHRAGISTQIWWLPIGAEDGHERYESHAYKVSRVVAAHPDWLILDRKGRPARVRRGLAALCPALPEVQDYFRGITERFIRDWDFDGNKLDETYTVPLCYNPKHHHRSPEDSVRAMGDLYRVIHDTTRSLKPESVTQICPCGTPPNLAWLNAMDQAVTADPVGSVQVRRRLKMYKALLGPEAAVYGDHVELTEVETKHGTEVDSGKDFASTVGLGGVVGTKFVWPDPGPHFDQVYLSPRKESLWKKWLAIYNSKMLSSGTFLNLYTYGFDLPEGYAIRKDGAMYYAFFSPGRFEGQIELRGLEPGHYRVRDYVNGADLGEVTAERPRLAVVFDKELLVEAAAD